VFVSSSLYYVYSTELPLDSIISYKSYVQEFTYEFDHDLDYTWGTAIDGFQFISANQCQGLLMH